VQPLGTNGFVSNWQQWFYDFKVEQLLSKNYDLLLVRRDGMIDYKQLFGYAAILFGLGFLLRSVLPAHAFNTSNVSLGTNPVESWSGYITSSTSSWETLQSFTNDFIITDFTISQLNQHSSCQIVLSNQNTSPQNVKDNIVSGSVSRGNDAYTSASQFSHRFSSGMKVNAGDTLYMYYSNNGQCFYNIAGYHIHTP